MSSTVRFGLSCALILALACAPSADDPLDGDSAPSEQGDGEGPGEGDPDGASTVTTPGGGGKDQGNMDPDGEGPSGPSDPQDDAGSPEGSPDASAGDGGDPGPDGGTPLAHDGGTLEDGGTGQDGSMGSPDGGASTDAGDGAPEDGGKGTPECQPGTCCIGGEEYFAGAQNPDNRCERCEPDDDTSDFTPIDGALCGAGCLCAGGRATETLCYDQADNDDDGRQNCRDADCNGQLCRESTTQRFSPTRDLVRSQGRPDSDGQEVLHLANTMNGVQYAVLEFDDFPIMEGLRISAAHLHFVVETAGVSVTVRNPDNRDIGTAPAQTPGPRSVEITSLVKQWVSGEEHQKLLYLYYLYMGAAYVRASEHSSETSRPYISVQYEAQCTAGACPAL